MAVISSAFGQVKLTESDAKKFKNQVTYGKPKATAKATAEKGSERFNEYASKGKVVFKVNSSSK